MGPIFGEAFERVKTVYVVFRLAGNVPQGCAFEYPKLHPQTFDADLPGDVTEQVKLGHAVVGHGELGAKKGGGFQRGLKVRHGFDVKRPSL